MYNESDFIIENGILTKYTGPGGDVVIPAGVTCIGRQAFHECTDLASVKLPRTVTKIDIDAFSQCTGLEEIQLPEGAAFSLDDVFKPCVRLLG